MVVFPSRQVRRECGHGPENARPVGCGEASAGAQTLLLQAAVGQSLSPRRLRLASAAGTLAALSPLLPRVFSGDEAVIDRATAGLLVLAVMLVLAIMTTILIGRLNSRSSR